MATSLNNLAALNQEKGNYAKAESLHLRSIAIGEKALGKEHPEVATSLNNLAGLYKSQGSYAKAESLYLRSLAIREKVLGKEHPDVANSLNSLAGLYYSQGSYVKAESLFLRSLAIEEKALGKEHPDLVTSLNNLAGLYESQGSYAKAESLYLRSLAIGEKALGKEHPDVANSLNGLAGLYKSQGSYVKAESLYLRSLAIREKVLGKEHPDMAISLNGLALLHYIQGNYAKAEPLYLRSLAIQEKVFGKEHPNVATILDNLGSLYDSQDKYKKAETYKLRSLAIREKVLGKKHPSVAVSLNNLGTFYVGQGNYTKAESFLLRSLAIFKKYLGKEHPRVADSLNNLALVYWKKDDISGTTNFLSRGLEIEEKNLQLIYAVGSEQRKQNYAKTFNDSTHIAVSLALQEYAKNSTTAKLALTTVLRRKGRVLDAITDTVQILRAQLAENPEIQTLFDNWLDVQQQLAKLVYSGQEQKTEKIQKLEAQKERLEEQVSAKSAEFRKEIQLLELKAIQAKIPEDAALIEIVQYKPFNPKLQLDSKKKLKPRYAAAVLRSQGEPNWVDLGNAATIDRAIKNFRKVLVSPIRYKSQGEKVSRELDKLIMTPIRPLLGNARHLLLSPDGQLNLIPFEALKDDKNQYLVERYSFSYLTSGRDLLGFDIKAKQLSNPVIFADIDYDEYQNTVVAKNRGTENQRSIDFSNISFDLLPGTAVEGKEIQKIVPNINLVAGKQATETMIKGLKAPSILHLATHGFFLPQQKVDNKLKKSKAVKSENPLLRSGLALAGSNGRQNRQNGNGEDGVLTALEVAGLNLRGTKLVVLSACGTGLGDVKTGEGVYGLRRALVISGSQSQLLSLWAVSDNGTKDLMVKYYQNLKAGKGRHEALREVQLEFIKSSRYKNPYYWASFIPSGNWRRMKLVH